MVMIMGNVITPLLSSIFSIALMPSGTDAPPIPSTLVERDSERYFLASLFIESFPHNRFIKGDKMRDKKLLNFVFSTIPNIPNHTAYIASNSNDKESALLVASIIEGRSASGDVKHKNRHEKKQIITQILFILKFIVGNCSYIIAN